MGGKNKADAPDYRGAAEEQAQASREVTEQQTWANRPTQINPWGTVQWDTQRQWDPATQQYLNRWTQETTLDPRLQSALGSQMNLMAGRSGLGAGMMQDIAGDLGPAMDFSRFGSQYTVEAPQNVGLGGLPGRVSDVGTTNYAPEQLQRNLNYTGASAINAPEFTRQSAEDSLYNRQAQRLNQQFGGEQNALEIKLANRGLRPGDEAWDAAMQNFNQRKTDAFQGAQAQAMQLGGQEAQRMFQMESALRGQQTGEVDRMADFYNRAALGQFGMGSQAQQQAFRDRLSAADLQNQQRDAAMRERMGLQQFNMGQQYQWTDQQNQLRQQAMNEELMRRNQRLNEVNALISGQQVASPQFQGFMGANASQAPQYLQAAQLAGQQAAANQSAENAAFGNLMGGLTGSMMGAGMMGFSPFG